MHPWLAILHCRDQHLHLHDLLEDGGGRFDLCFDLYEVVGQIVVCFIGRSRRASRDVRNGLEAAGLETWFGTDG